LPSFGLKTDNVGTIVDISPSGQQITLEFFNFAGDTVAVVPVKANQVRHLADNEVMHARTVVT
jgi:hypothetical protein